MEGDKRWSKYFPGILSITRATRMQLNGAAANKDLSAMNYPKLPLRKITPVTYMKKILNNFLFYGKWIITLTFDDNLHRCFPWLRLLLY